MILIFIQEIRFINLMLNIVDLFTPRWINYIHIYLNFISEYLNNFTIIAGIVSYLSYIYVMCVLLYIKNYFHICGFISRWDWSARSLLKNEVDIGFFDNLYCICKCRIERRNYLFIVV